MRVNERMRKLLSMVLCLCMLVQNAPVMAFAATGDNLCDHHAEHTAECGYVEGQSECTYHCDECLGHDHDIQTVEVTVPETEPSEEPTEPSEEVTKPSEEPTEPSEEVTKPSGEPTEPSEEPTEPSGEPTEPSGEPTEPSTEATEPAPVCTCESDEPDWHAPFCDAYIAPEDPECFCVEVCGQDWVNAYCDICYFDPHACWASGEEEAVDYAATPTYIASIGIAQDGSSGSTGVNDCKNELSGHTIIDRDLNDGAGGDYIYMGYKTTTDPSKAITGILLRVGQNPPERITDNGKAYFYLVGKGETNTASEGGYVDLNAKAGGDYIYLYVTRDPSYGAPLTALTVDESSSKSGYSTATNTSGNVIDLNQGAGGDYLYLHYKRFSATVTATYWYMDGNGNRQKYEMSKVITDPNQTVELDKTDFASSFNYNGKKFVSYALYGLDRVWREDDKALRESSGTTSVNLATSGKVMRQVYVTDNVILYNQDLAILGYEGQIGLTYDTNGGTGTFERQTAHQFLNAGASSVVLGDAEFTLHSHKPTYAGKCAFLGWSTNKNATTASYQPGETIGVKDTTVLYAIWKDHGNTKTDFAYKNESQHTYKRGCCGETVAENHSYSNGICSFCGAYMPSAVAVLSKNGKNIFAGTTLDAVITEAEKCTAGDKAVVTILQDIDLGTTKYQRIDSGVFTIDLNGRKLSYDYVDYSTLYISNSGTDITLISSLPGGTVENRRYNGKAIVTGSNTNLTATGISVITGSEGDGIRLNGNANLSDVTVQAGEWGIYTQNNATLTCTNCTVQATETALYVNGDCTATITGGSLTDGEKDIYALGSVTVAGTTFPGGINISYKDLNKILAEGYAYWAGDTMLQPADNAMEITGLGDITVKAACTHESGTKQNYVNNGEDHTYTRSCCNQTVTETHTFDAATQFCPCGQLNPAAVAQVIMNGAVVSGHTTLNGAIQAVKSATEADEAVVKILQPITLTARQNVESGVFTLDLNGQTITGSKQYVIYITAGTVTIADSGENGTITGGDFNVYNDNGTVTITGGTINSGFYGVYNNTGTLSISGGTITGGRIGVRNNNGTLSITGGAITGGTTGAYIDSGTASITGGTITGGTTGVEDFRSTVTITGGTITGDQYDLIELNGTITLTLGENGTGATFPGGITVYVYNNAQIDTALDAVLAEGAAYWQGDKMILPAEDATEITGGDVVIKAVCPHADVTYTDNGETHTFTCTDCGSENVVEAHEYADFICICGAVSPEAVAKTTLGETVSYHATLDAAIQAVSGAAAADNAVVTLIADIEMGNRYQEITSGVFTLDLNDRAISSTNSIQGALYIKSSAAVTIADSGENGTITGTVYGVQNSATLNITDGAITASYYGVYNYASGTLSISGGTITADRYSVYNSGGSVSISGGTITGRIYGVYADEGAVTITGGEISGTDSGLYVSGSTVTISGGTITGDYAGVNALGGTVTITDGTITSDYAGVNAYVSTVTITGGKITGETYDIYANESTFILGLGEDKIGTTFPGGLSVYNTTLNACLAEGAAYWQGDKMILPAEDATEIAGDVTVKAVCTHEGVTYTDNGETHTFTCTDCGSENVVEAHEYADCICICGAVSPEAVAKTTLGETVSYHATLDAAIQAASGAAAADNAVVTLLADIDLGTGNQTIASGVFTLDLNDRTISSAHETQGALYIKSSAAVTIADSGENGAITGALYGADNNRAALTITDGTITGSTAGVNCVMGSTLTITGGTITGSGAVGILNNGIITITGGTVTGNGGGISVIAGIVTITGGTITGNDRGIDVKNGKVTISGGTISGGQADLYKRNDDRVSIILTLGENGTGAAFPGGIQVTETTLKAVLAEGAAYWQGDKMILPAGDATEITGGDVVIKAVCDHSENESTEYTYVGDAGHSVVCTECGVTFTAAHGDMGYVNQGETGHKVYFACCQTESDAITVAHTLGDVDTCPCGYKAKAKIVDTYQENLTVYYATLPEALAAAENWDVASDQSVSVYAMADYDGDFTIPDNASFYGEEFIFNGAVTNEYAIHSGTFVGEVTNWASIYDGTFNGEVRNEEHIEGGTFNGAVDSDGTIKGGTFNGKLINNEGGVIENHGTDITIGKGFVYVANGGTVTGDHAYSEQHKCWCGDLKTFTITYDLVGGTLVEEETNPKTYNVESEAFTLVNPTKVGYDFIGWTGNGITEPTLALTVATGTAGDLTFTANWQIKTYTVSMHEYSEGVEIVSVNGDKTAPFTVEHGQKLEILLKNTISQKRSDVWFYGCYVNGSFVDLEDYSATSITIEGNYVTGNVEIDADALALVTVDMAGGTFAADRWADHYTVEDSIATMTDDWARSSLSGYIPGYEFVKAGHTMVKILDKNGTEYAVDQAVSVTSDLELTLVWSCNSGSLTPVAGYPPSCNEVGYEDHFKCSCGRLYLDGAATQETTLEGVTVPVTHVAMEPVEAQAATCMAEGSIAHYKCESCGKLFEDADGTVEITDVSTPIDSNAHSWNDGEITTNPTCTTVGVKTFTCEHDEGHTYTEDVAIDADAHTGTFGTPVSTEGGKHVASYTCCGMPGEPEDHTFTYSANDAAGTITATCSENCGFTATAVISAENATYDGTAKKTANITYSEGWPGGELTVSYASNVNAGTATASISLGNATARVEFTIEKAKAVIDVDTTTIYVTYGETVTLPSAKTNFGTVSCDKTAADLKNAGTYTVTYTVEGAANFEGDTKTLQVVIGQKPVAEPTVTGTYTYTGSEQTVVLTGVESYMTVASGNKGTNAGNYEAVITLDGNYKWADGSDGKLQWNIAKAKAAVTVDTTPITVTYGEAVTLPSATTNFGTAVCDKTAADLKNAGTHTVTYTVEDTANFEGDAKSITVTINAKAITVTADALSKTYGDADPELTYQVEGLVNGDELTGELKRVEGENVGSYAIEQNTLTAGDNYTITYVGANLTIIAKSITDADVKLNGSLTYTGQEQTQPITVTAGITYEVSGNKATDAGTYELTVKGTGNYTGEVKRNWSVQKAAAAVTKAPAAKTLTYTGEAQVLVNAGTTADGEMVYSLSENGAYTETIPTGKNAGEYMVWYYVKGDSNHLDSSKESVVVTIAKATYDMTGAKWDYTAAFDYNGLEHTVTVVNLPAGVTAGGYTGNAATIVGEYTAKVILDYDQDNYNAPSMEDLNWSIVNNWEPVEFTFTPMNSNDYRNTDFVVTAAEGYAISCTNTANGEWASSLTESQETDKGSITFYLKNNATGAISLAKTMTYKLDKTTPTGKVAFVERSSWQEFVNDITFGLFYGAEVTVKAEAADTLSGVDTIEYASADKAMTLEEVKTIASWKTMPNSGVAVALEDTKKFVYFVRITDKAGNVTYLSTDGAEYDTTAPVISGVENGKTYYTTQVVTVTEKNLDTLSLNGKAAQTTITLDGDKNITYTIVAKDKAGNETTVTVTMKTIASLGDSVEDLTVDNATSADKDEIQAVLDAVNEILKDDKIPAEEKADLEDIAEKAQQLLKAIDDAAKVLDTEDIQKVEDKDETNAKLDDKTDLQKAKDALEDALSDENKGNYTPQEQAAIQQEIDRLEKAIEAIEQTEAVIAAIAGLPKAVEPDLKEEDEKAIRDAKAAFDKLPDYQKSLVDKDDREKLEALFDSLDDYKIIKGSGKKWEKGSGNSLQFTANGPVRKFKELRIDSKVVSTSNYTVKEGSTIVTLKASYLQSLSAGKHTIQFVYTDGETDGKDIFRIYNSGSNPATGESMDPVFFSGIMLTSLLCMAALLLNKKKFYER